MTYGPIAAASLLGLASIPHCMGMCGPIAGACSGSRASSLGYQAARLGSYAALGALASTLASPLRDALPAGLAAYLLAAIMAASLLTSAVRVARTTAPRPDVPAARLARPRASHPLMPVGLGLLTGILPCGSLYGALAVSAAAPDSVVGGLSMLAFGSFSALGLMLSQAATHALARDASGRGKKLVAAVLVVGAALALLRPLVAASPEDAPCHSTEAHLAVAPSAGGLAR